MVFAVGLVVVPIGVLFLEGDVSILENLLCLHWLIACLAILVPAALVGMLGPAEWTPARTIPLRVGLYVIDISLLACVLIFLPKPSLLVATALFCIGTWLLALQYSLDHP